MTKYNVHLYREMRLLFQGIEADTPDAAAALAREKPTRDADDIEDCNGEDLGALIDVAGDADYEQSVTIDFDGERQRKAAPRLLSALKACELQLGEYVRWHHAHAGGCSVEIESAWEKARDAIAAASTAGIAPTCRPPSRFEFTDEPQESSDRAYVLVDGLFDVAIIRTDEGLVVDVYPRHGPDAIASTYAFASDAVPHAGDAPGSDEAKEA